MRYICFGYLDVESWEKKTRSEQDAMMDACFAYDAELKQHGHWRHGEGLQGATSLQYANGKVSVTDGPYAETKEVLGGLLIIEAADLDEAIRLISAHPGVKMGRWEIRPGFDVEPLMRESEQRRALAGR